MTCDHQTGEFVNCMKGPITGIIASRTLQYFPFRSYPKLLRSSVQAPFSPLKGFPAVTDHSHPSVTEEVSLVTSQESDSRLSLVLWDLLNVYAEKEKDPTSEHVLAYLAKAKDDESDEWLKDDIQIAWLTVLYAARDYPQPAVNATYATLGVHPNKVWAKICRNREALLGVLANDPEFASPTPPKKQPIPVKEKAAAARA